MRAPRNHRRLRVAVCAVTVAALSTSLAGCGSSSDASSGEKNVKLGLVYYQSNVNAFQEMAYGARSAAQDSPGVSLTSSAPASEDPAKELQMFQSAMQVAKDGIVLQTLRGDMFLRPVQQAEKRNIPVIAIDAPLPEAAGAELFVTNDNAKVGADVAKTLLAKIPASAKGEVVIGTNGPAIPPLQDRVKGMLATIKSERPDLKIVGPVTTGTTGTDNLASWSSLLKAHPKALAYMAPSDIDAASIAVISKQTGKKYNVGGCDLEQAALQGIKDGYITALGSPEHWLKGFVAMKILANHAQDGADIPKGVWDTGDLVVDAKNVDDIIARQKSASSRADWFRDEADKQVADPSAHLVS
jgi:ribose transport system substrate-binding protein